MITTETRGHVLLIGIDRAAKKNAFDLALLAELARAYTAFEEEPDLRCALLFAHGGDFTTGLDLASVAPELARGAPFFPHGLVDPLDLRSPRRTKPVVAAAQGWCLTLGIELLLASDVRLAADDTRFAQLEVQRGTYPFGGATLRFPRVAGWGGAMRWMLTGERFDAQEALRLGLVQAVYPAGDLLARAVSMAETIAAQAPLAVQATRRSSLMALEEGDRAAQARLMSDARDLLATEDAAEGVRSFVERRAGRFVGR